jgi:hypothetical protein
MLTLLGLAWLILGAAVLTDMHPAMALDPALRFFLGAGMLAAGLVGLALAALLWRRSRLAYFGSLAFLIGGVVAVLFDDIGWTDLTFIAANVIPIILLLKDRLWYLRS